MNSRVATGSVEDSPLVFGTLSPGIASLPGIRDFLDGSEVLLRPVATNRGRIDAYVGWGRKPTSDRAREIAKMRGKPFLSLEDGFLRSPGGPGEDVPPLSLLLDEIGVHYDASQPSRIEAMISSLCLGKNDALMARAAAVRDRLIEAGLSKYNPRAVEMRPRGPQVLVLGQVEDDLSLRFGMKTPMSALTLCRMAIQDNPGKRVIYRLHPDIVHGRRPPPADLSSIRRIAEIDASGGPLAEAFDDATRVYTATSGAGLEAMIRGIPVVAAGMPFWAGWGASTDRGPSTGRRHRRRSAMEIFAASYLLYARYRDPFTGHLIKAEEALDLADAMRQRRQRLIRPVLVNVTSWKQARCARIVAVPDEPAVPVASPHSASSAAIGTERTVVAWATRTQPADITRWRAAGASVALAEDGFLRSGGLGAALTLPLSLTVDRQRPHYDPTGPSDLEEILGSALFSEAELQAADELISLMRKTGVGKYGPSSGRDVDVPDGPFDLVLGQVADDASLRNACGATDNANILRRVRESRPEQRIIFRPHPDVVAGLRPGAVPPELLAKLRIEPGRGPLPQLVAAATCVHTISSLGGMEALILDAPVICHGWPFYAGWGLTLDAAAPPGNITTRRRRRLTLRELVAGAYIRYPFYFDPVSGLPCDALTAARRITEGAASEKALPWPVRRVWEVICSVRSRLPHLTTAA